MVRPKVPPSVKQTQLLKNGYDMADSTIELHQFLKLVIQATDGRGNSVPIIGIPVWTSGDTHVITLTASPDGLSATANPQGLGLVDITVTGNGLSGIFSVEVTGPRIIFQSMAAVS